ncbi:hypothetical protein QCA50_014978 [Cerrena zonata]|uniref:Uncharacterized protein n=1 Tax=Cerrena zonata TaxID=2478898 RepID=A0AAW0FUR8_9APHY
MPAYPKPTTEPTPFEDVRLVVLGGSEAGIHLVANEQGMSPLMNPAGPCFPISIYCRSLAEAEKVWQLQGLVEIVEKEAEKKVAAAFITNVVVCHLFTKDQTAVFHAALLGFYRRPMIFFSWADVHRYTLCFPDTRVQRAKTFVDAILYLWLSPRTPANLSYAVEFVRPPPPEHIVLAGSRHQSLPMQTTSRTIEASPPMASTSTSMPHVVVVGDSSDDEAPAPVSSSHSERKVSSIPTWVSNILQNADIADDTVLYRTRSIKGERIHNYTRAAPTTMVLVPSLGAVVDIVVDGLGFTPNTIRRLHTMFIDARLLSPSHNGQFLNVMGGYGMSLVEAAMFWDLIHIPNGTTFKYREMYIFTE